MEGTLPEGDIKRAIREEGATVAEVVVIAADTGSGMQYFPFVRIPAFGEELHGVRKARTAGLVSFTHLTPLIGKLQAEPVPDTTGGFAWEGTKIEVLFPGDPRLADITAAQRWR